MTRIVRDELGHLKAVPSWRPVRYSDLRPVTGPVFLAVNRLREIDARLADLERRSGARAKSTVTATRPAAPAPAVSDHVALAVLTGVWPGVIVGRPK